MGHRELDEATFERETARNREAYEKLREQIRREHAGRYIAFGEGRVLVSATDFDAVRAAVEGLPSVPEYYLIFPADMEPPFEPYYAFYQEPYLPD